MMLLHLFWTLAFVPICLLDFEFVLWNLPLCCRVWICVVAFALVFFRSCVFVFQIRKAFYICPLCPLKVMQKKQHIFFDGKVIPINEINYGQLPE